MLTAIQVILEADEKSWCTLTAEANNKVLGRRLGQKVSSVKKELSTLDADVLWPLLEVRVHTQALFRWNHATRCRSQVRIHYLTD